MIGLPIIFAVVVACAFIALLVMAIVKPAPASEEKPPQTWPGPDCGPWGKRT